MMSVRESSSEETQMPGRVDRVAISTPLTPQYCGADISITPVRRLCQAVYLRFMKVILFSLFACALAAQSRYDVLLKGGHVVDPKNRIDAIRDVAIAGGRIARVAEKIDAAEARQVIDVSGLYV